MSAGHTQAVVNTKLCLPFFDKMATVMVGKGGDNNERDKRQSVQRCEDVDNPANGRFSAGACVDGPAMGGKQGLSRHNPGGTGHSDSTGGDAGMVAGARVIG